MVLIIPTQKSSPAAHPITKALQNGWLIAPMTIITTHKHLDKP